MCPHLCRSLKRNTLRDQDCHNLSLPQISPILHQALSPLGLLAGGGCCCSSHLAVGWMPKSCLFFISGMGNLAK